MKKFKIAAMLMAFVAFSFAMTSCQKAEDLIIGKWQCVKVVDDGQTYTEGENVDFTYEFKADNTLAMNGISYGTYAVDGDVLTITVMGFSQNLNIDKITKSKLVLSDPDKPENIAEFKKI